MTPEQIAAEVLAVDASTLSATRIKGGLTNESWLVKGHRDAVVVRISTVDEQALQLNRSSEALALAAAQQAGIGAEVLLCEPARRLLVTRLLDAETLAPEVLHETVMIELVAKLLRQLHQMPIPPDIQQIDLASTLLGYWHSLDAQLPQTVDAETRRHAMHIAIESTQIGVRCLCHNDVHHLNLMFNGQRLWLLDWEYAGIGDALFDLAAVCCYHRYDQALREQLLLAYSGEVDRGVSERLDRMCWLFEYIKELWLAVRQNVQAAL